MNATLTIDLEGLWDLEIELEGVVGYFVQPVPGPSGTPIGLLLLLTYA